MAKKGKNKKGKNKKIKVKKNYNKKEFSEVFCQTCLICNKAKPGFCYSSLYKVEPKSFVNKVFNNLVDIGIIYHAKGRSMRTMSIEQFQNVVCKTGICHNGDNISGSVCDSIKQCYTQFMVQMDIMFSSATEHEENISDLVDFKNNRTNKQYISFKKKRNKKKGQQRYVCTPYATFFSKNNEIFQAEIRKILYGDNDIKQDKDKELSATDSGATDRHTEGGEPKVQRGSV